MRRSERGATIVEAALVIPIVLMFLIGIMEFGRAHNEYQVLTNAAREACRYAVAPSPGRMGQMKLMRPDLRVLELGGSLANL